MAEDYDDGSGATYETIYNTYDGDSVPTVILELDMNHGGIISMNGHEVFPGSWD